MIFINFYSFSVNQYDESSQLVGKHLKFRRDSSNSSEDDLKTIKKLIYDVFVTLDCDFNDFHLNLVLKSLHEKRRNGDPWRQDRDIVFERHDYVANHKSKEHEMLSDISVPKNFTGTNVIKIEKTKDLMVNANNRIDIPFIVSKVGIGEEFGQNDTFTMKLDKLTKTNQGNITVNVPPFSKIYVSLYVYEYVDVHNYFLDFELDDASAVSCAPYNPKTLREFLPEGKYRSKGLQLEHVDDKFIIKNVPASETVVSFGIRTKFEPAEKIEYASPTTQKDL